MFAIFLFLIGFDHRCYSLVIYLHKFAFFICFFSCRRMSFGLTS